MFALYRDSLVIQNNQAFAPVHAIFLSKGFDANLLELAKGFNSHNLCSLFFFERILAKVVFCRVTIPYIHENIT